MLVYCRPTETVTEVRWNARVPSPCVLLRIVFEDKHPIEIGSVLDLSPVWFYFGLAWVSKHDFTFAAVRMEFGCRYGGFAIDFGRCDV